MLRILLSIGLEFIVQLKKKTPDSQTKQTLVIIIHVGKHNLAIIDAGHYIFRNEALCVR